jgi:hypothetical protein
MDVGGLWEKVCCHGRRKEKRRMYMYILNLLCILRILNAFEMIVMESAVT